MNREKCSVLLPVRNGEKFLQASLENLLQITIPGDEIVVIDDGSTDRTSSILMEIQKIDERICIISIPPTGLVAALNKGLEAARNELVARADVDDSYSLERLDLQVAYLRSNPDIVAVFSDYIFFSESKKNFGYMPTGVTPSATKLSLVDAFRTPHPSVTFRRSAVMQVGGYLEDDFPAEDLGLWIRLSSKYELGSLPLPLLNYQLNPAGVSASRQLVMRRKRDELLSKLDYRELLAINLNSYKKVKNSYLGLSHRGDRLALHNFDLCICINRAPISLSSKLKALLKVAFRFINPQVSLAFLRLLLARRARHQAS
jgi:glycosyltransferase involved in cell wall biosynthesis